MAKKKKKKKKAADEEADVVLTIQPQEPGKELPDGTDLEQGQSSARFSVQISELVYIRTFFILVGFALGVYLVYSLSSVITPILFALVLAYLINPLVDRFQNWGATRNFAISLLVISISFLGVMVVVLLLPALSESMEQLAKIASKLPSLIMKAKVWIQSKFSLHFPENWTEALKQWGDEIKTYAPKAIKPVGVVVRTVFSSGYNLLLALFHVVLVPLFTFYFLKDWHSMKDKAFQHVPPRYRESLLSRFVRIDGMISGFVHGQITVSLIVGTLYMILLTTLKVPLAPAIAVGGALINVVPYLGFFLTFATSLIACLFDLQSGWQFFAVFLGMGFIHALDVLLITPKVVGDKVGLSEVVVIIAVLAGGNLFGFLGVLVAVPTAAIIKVLMEDVIRKYHSSPFYKKGDEDAKDTN